MLDPKVIAQLAAKSAAEASLKTMLADSTSPSARAAFGIAPKAESENDRPWSIPANPSILYESRPSITPELRIRDEPNRWISLEKNNDMTYDIWGRNKQPKPEMKNLLMTPDMKAEYKTADYIVDDWYAPDDGGVIKKLSRQINSGDLGWIDEKLRTDPEFEKIFKDWYEDETGDWDSIIKQNNIDDMIAIATEQVGYIEKNGNKVMFNNNTDQPWCVSFVQWVAKKAGIELAHTSTASTDEMKQAYIKAGNFGDGNTYTPTAGDLIFYQMPNPKDGGHTGLVVANVVNDDGKSGTIYSIEGNTYVNNGEPDGVYVKVTYYEMDNNGNYTYYRSKDANNKPKPLPKPVVNFGKNGGTSMGTPPVQ